MMETKELKKLAAGLEALAVFRPLLADPVLAALKEYLDASSAGRYAAFVAALYEANGGELGRHVLRLCEDSANVYVRTVGAGQTPPACMAEALTTELDCLQRVADLGPDALLAALPEAAAPLPRYEAGGVDLPGSYMHRAENIHRYGYGVWAANRMFYLDEAGRITPVSHPDTTKLEDLVDYEAQRAIILRNTRALLEGKPAANILLTGDAGTGKSSAVKAIGNALFGEGLRIIEVRKDQLRAIPHVLDELAANPLKFVLFIDDLSFLKDDDNYSALKAVLEGSVTAKSKNVVIYATSNRRHIIKEKFSDREGDEVHRNDTMQELVSLSERFGIHITFSKPDKATFLHIVRHLAAAGGVQLPADELERRAERYALERGGRSARLARQFVDGLLAGM